MTGAPVYRLAYSTLMAIETRITAAMVPAERTDDDTIATLKGRQAPRGARRHLRKATGPDPARPEEY